MKNALQLSAIVVLILTACAASRPEEPWRVEVRTVGGFSGHGIGSYAIDSDGNISVEQPNGKACSYRATSDELRQIRRLLGDARPREWKPSYNPKNTCCDRIHYALFIDEASVVTRTQWIDAPLPMPADLVALTDAIVGGEDSIRVRSAERCRE